MSRAWTDEEARKFTAPCADRHQWDAWLAAHDARVRRDAAREALDGLAAEVRLEWHERHHWLLQPIDEYRDDSYPEETP